MDFSKYIEMKMQAANTYKSNWQGRDASELTMRKHQMAQKNNSSTHRGPANECCTGGTPPTAKRPSSPINGFSTTYEQSIVSQKVAGCVQCNDPVIGTAGGVQLLTCAEVATILAVPPNPVKGSECPCADPGVPLHQTYPPKTIPSYTGWRNQVPANPQPSSFLAAVELASG